MKIIKVDEAILNCFDEYLEYRQGLLYDED